MIRETAVPAKRFKRSEKIARVQELRDAAVAIARHFGSWKTISGIKVISARVATLSIIYRTPFSMPGPTDRGWYGIDVWARKKVLNVEWHLDCELALLSFHPGEWEMELKAAARSLAHAHPGGIRGETGQ